MLSLCIQPGMEPLRDNPAICYCNIPRQIGIQICLYLLWRQLRLYFYIGNLCPGMYPGIRASGTMDFHRMSGHPAENLFDFPLYGMLGIALLLPSAVPFAIILYLKTKICHKNLCLSIQSSLL